MASLKPVSLDSLTGTAIYFPVNGSSKETETILLEFLLSIKCPHWLNFANRYEEMLKSSK